MPIAVDDVISGMLLVAKDSPDPFPPSWDVMLGLLSMGLVPQVKNEQVGCGVCGVGVGVGVGGAWVGVVGGWVGVGGWMWVGGEDWEG